MMPRKKRANTPGGAVFVVALVVVAFAIFALYIVNAYTLTYQQMKTFPVERIRYYENFELFQKRCSRLTRCEYLEYEYISENVKKAYRYAQPAMFGDGYGRIGLFSRITDQLVMSLHEGDIRHDADIFERMVYVYDMNTLSSILTANALGKLDKNKAVELYLNHGYYGYGAIGIEAAAKNYFNISARKLDAGQAAFLVTLLCFRRGDPFDKQTGLVVDRIRDISAKIRNNIDDGRSAKYEYNLIEMPCQ